jgi:hypothetical protein
VEEMLGISEMIEEGKIELACEAAEREAERARIQREDEAERELAMAAMRAQIAPLIPEVMQPYADYAPLSAWVGVRSQTVDFFEVPGCSHIRATFSRDGDAWTLDPVWRVEVPNEDNDNELETKYVNVAGLEKALATAAMGAERIAERKAQLEARKAEQEADFQRWKMNDDEQEALAREARKAQDSEIERMIELVKADDIAATLVRLFIALQDERERLREWVASRDEAMTSIEDRYQSRLRAMAEAVTRAENDRDEERRAREDTEERVRKLKGR